MKTMNVIKDFKNDLLKRREVKVVITADKNPGVEHAAKTVAEHFKSGEDCVAVKTLKSKFGRDTFLIDAFVYETAADKAKVEPKKKEKKAAEGTAPAPAAGGKN